MDGRDAGTHFWSDLAGKYLEFRMLAAFADRVPAACAAWLARVQASGVAEFAARVPAAC